MNMDEQKTEQKHVSKKVKYVYNKRLPIIKNNWQGNIYINGKFYNDKIPVKLPISRVLKWKLSHNLQKAEKQKDSFRLPVVSLNDFTDNNDKIIWLGHSTFLITINGVKIITDPCFFDIPMTTRKIPIPCEIKNVNNLDYLLISHDHRDHFDINSIKHIVKNNPEVEALVPLKMSELFKHNKLNKIRIQEAGWYQMYDTNKDIQIILLPARHWGRRGIFDFNKTLWGGFLIITKSTKIFFGGDTAYSGVFKKIQKTFGDMDICILPIGAYAPDYAMKQSHATPEEAHQIFNDLCGKIFIPMHYGTYDLSDEPLGEPVKRIDNCFLCNKKALKLLAVGEKYLISQNL